MWPEKFNRVSYLHRLGRCAGLLLIASQLAIAERLPIKAYTTADGLAHNEINKIVRDSRGFLWFCTADGLSRFDGYTFTNFGTDQGLPNRNVTDLLETHAGEYWLATNGGLVWFNPKGIPAKNLVYLNDVSPNAAPLFSVLLPDDVDRRAKAITALFEDRSGTVWCGTMKGLYRLERENARFTLRPVEIGIPHEFPDQALINDILEDPHGSLWIAAVSGLYRRWADGSFARYAQPEGLPSEHLHDLFMDHTSQLWAATRLAGFFSFTADASHKPPVINRVYSSKEGLPTNWVFQLFETADRHFWIATNLGLVEFFPDAKETGPLFHAYSKRNGLSFHEITALNEDLGGNLWVGTNTSGAMKLTRDGFITYDERDGLETALAIFEDREGGVCFRGWVLGDPRAGVFEGARLDLLNAGQATSRQRFGRFDGQRFSWRAPKALKGDTLGWVGEHVTLQARNGEWWMAGQKGVYRFPAGSFAQLVKARPLAVFNEKNGLAAAQAFRLFEDSRGDIWISTISSVTGNGLARWERAEETLRDMAKTPTLPSLKDDLARSFGEDRAGNVWIGFNTGLARYRNGSFTFFTAKDGLPPGGVLEIYSDSTGRLWLASSRGGLVRIDDPGAEHPTFRSYTTAEGLSSNDAEVITEDLYGRIYVGTGRGLDRLDPATGRVMHFTTADGLAGGEIRAAFRDRSGALWFGTTKGLSRLLPTREQTGAPPPILITGLQLAGSRQVVSPLGEKEMTLPDLAAAQNQLQIDFVGLNFAPGEVLRYQFKVEGANADWSAPTDQRTVNYANLAPGRYRFLVRAMNSNGLTSSTPAAISFRILPPLWQRWWFLVLVALSLGLVAFALYRYRVARILEVANMRTRIATDLHDDIGANLTKISILSEVAKQEHGNGDETEDSPLSSIARISRESVASMSDIVWAINPKRDHLIDLVRRMRRHAEELSTARDIKLTFQAPGEEQDLRLGVDVRRDLFLIFKEAMNNAARHSQCSNITVDFQVDASWLTLRIADDGVGFDLSSDSDGHGLENMRQRAEVLGGEFTIRTGANGGTSILLKIPYARSRRLFGEKGVDQPV